MRTAIRRTLIGLSALAFAFAAVPRSAAAAGSVAHCGKVATSQTWSGAHHTTCAVVVPQNITLTIASGSSLSLPRQLIVQGRLVADGVTITGSGGVLVDGRGQVNISNSTISGTLLELRPSAVTGSSLQLASNTVSTSTIRAGATARPALGSVVVTAGSLTTTTVNVITNAPSRLESVTVSSGSVKVVGSTPVISNNTFTDTPITLGDQAVRSLVTDTQRVTGNTFTNSSVSFGKVFLGGEFTGVTQIATSGDLTVPARRTLSITDATITGSGNWTIAGTLELSDSTVTVRAVTVRGTVATDPKATFSLTDSTLTGPIYVGGNSAVAVSRSTLTNSNVTLAQSSPVPLQSSDSVTISDSTLTNSPVFLKRTALRMASSVPVSLSITGSSLTDSRVESWSSTNTTISSTTLTDSPTTVVGGAPTITNNTLDGSPLTLGDTVNFGVVTDLLNVSGNTATPSNTVFVGRAILGGSFDGLSLSLPHASAVATLPQGRSLTWADTTTTGPGALAVHGELSLVRGSLGNATVRLGALSSTATPAKLTITDTAVSSNLQISGGMALTAHGASFSGGSIKPAAAPLSALRATDTVEITGSSFSQTDLSISRSGAFYSVPVSIEGSEFSQGRLEVVSLAGLTLTDSTIADTVTRVVGGAPVIERNTISGTASFTLGDPNYDRTALTDLSALRANSSPGNANRTVGLGNVAITATTEFSGFAAISVPSALATVTIPENLAVTLGSVGISGSGTLRVLGNLDVTNAPVSIAKLTVGASSADGSTARLTVSGSTVSSTILLDGGSQLSIANSSITGGRVGYNPTTVVPARATDSVSITDSTVTSSNINLRRFSPNPVTTIVTTITDSAISRSTVAVWSNAQVDVSRNGFTATDVLLVGGAPVLAENSFNTSGSVTLGDPQTATTSVTDVSNVARNTVTAASTSALRTLTLGLTDIGSIALDGASGFSRIATTLRPVVSSPSGSATISNVTVSGPATWTLSGAAVFDTVTWNAPKVTAASDTGVVTLRGMTITNGTISSQTGGTVHVESSSVSLTKLQAGSPRVVLPPKSPTPGTISVTDSSVANSQLNAVEDSRITLTRAQLSTSPVSTLQRAVVTLDESTLAASPISAVSTTVSVDGSRFTTSQLSVLGGTLELLPGTTFVVPANAVGVAATNAAVSIEGAAGDPVVFTGVCDPSENAPAGCSTTQVESLRPRAAITLADRSSISATNAVFAFARTAVSADAYTQGVGQGALATTQLGVHDSDFVLTDTAVAFRPNWRTAECRYEAYFPVADAYFSTPHGWDVLVTPGASSAMRAYSTGVPDFSGILRGSVVSAFTTGEWLSRTSGVASPTWEPPVPSLDTLSSFVVDTTLNPQASTPASRAKNTNNLPFNVETCSLPVPTTPTPVSQGYPVALARLTTPAVPWSSATDDVALDGRATAVHAYTTTLEGQLGLDTTRSTHAIAKSLFPHLSLPLSELRQRFGAALDAPAREPVSAVENITVSRSRENDPILTVTWKAHVDANVVGYHIYVGRDGAFPTRYTASLGIPGRFVTMAQLDCSFTEDCEVIVSAISSDGTESVPAPSVTRPRSPFPR